MLTIDERITNFVDFFRHHISRVGQISEKYEDKEDSDVQLYQKILYVAILDTLAKCVFPRSRNRDRIVSFLRRFSKWTDVDRVSLPHIVQLTKQRPDPAYERLRDFAFGKLTTWVPGRLIHLESDPEVKQVKDIWPEVKDYQEPGNRDWRWESLQHANLFYKFRNNLIHEFRQLGDYHDLIDMEKPYYKHSYIGLDMVEQVWTLIYPRTFLKKLCEDSLEGVEEYLRKNRVDPTPFYTYGDFWLDELND